MTDRILIMVLSNSPDPTPVGYLFFTGGKRDTLPKMYVRIKPVIERQLTARGSGDKPFKFRALGAQWEYNPVAVQRA